MAKLLIFGALPLFGSSCAMLLQVCKPGYGVSDPAEMVNGVPVCRVCTGDQYSAGGPNAVCTPCPGKTTHDKRGATGPDECDMCKPGRACRSAAAVAQLGWA